MVPSRVRRVTFMNASFGAALKARCSPSRPSHFYSSRLGVIADVAGLLRLVDATIERRLLSNNVYFLTD
jgi:hypothetical protein